MIGCILIALSIIGSAIYVVEKLKPEEVIGYDEQAFHDLYAVPDNRPVEEEDDRPEDYGSDELKKFIDEFDNRIESLKEELSSSKRNRAGVVFDEDHSVIDSQYIAIPKEEYAK